MQNERARKLGHLQEDLSFMGSFMAKPVGTGQGNETGRPRGREFPAGPMLAQQRARYTPVMPGHKTDREREK